MHAAVSVSERSVSALRAWATQRVGGLAMLALVVAIAPFFLANAYFYDVAILVVRRTGGGE